MQGARRTVVLACILLSVVSCHQHHACTTANTTSMPFCDTSLPVPRRLQDLLARMTLEEKLPQLKGGIGGGITPAIDRLGIPGYQYHSEGLHGIRTTCKLGPRGTPLYSTMFPQVTGMAATGNLSLIRAMAAHMADEARAVYNSLDGVPTQKGGGLNYYGPTMNVIRDPRWGRAQESVSEDPWLNGAYSSSYVRGFQGDDDGVQYTKVAACCKHFYGYSLEDADGFTRHNFDAALSARDIQETYLPAFKACLAAKPEQVMCSYNSVNGVPACLDGHAQNGLLRGTWGWDGLIVSDCDAIDDAWKNHHFAPNSSAAVADGIRAGTDQNCGGTYSEQNLQAALQEGLLSTEEVDMALGRALTMKFNLGMFDSPKGNPYSEIGHTVLNSAAGRALAIEAAQQSIVLLKNLPNRTSTLPLQASALRRIAIIGPTADNAAVLMGGKTDYCPEHTVTLFDGLAARANGTQLKVSTDDGSEPHRARKLAQQSDVVIAAVGGVLGGEANDRTVLTLPSKQQALLKALLEVAGSKMVLVVVSGEPVSIDEYVGKLGSIVHAIEGGQAAGTGLADVLFGAVSPSGVLPYTMYPADYVNMVKMSDMSTRPNKTAGSPGRTYRFYTGTPLFPFGFGLSYVKWSLSWGQEVPTTEQTAAALLKGLRWTVRVTNLGNMAASKTIQLYLSYAAQGITDPPIRTLVAMSKVWVSAGATVTSTLDTNAIEGSCAFCCVYLDGSSNITRGTRYSVSVGDGATNVLVSSPILVVA